jgi:hypothetical protein
MVSRSASRDDGVLVVSIRQAAPMLEAVEGTFADVAAAVGVLVVAQPASAGATAQMRWTAAGRGSSTTRSS